MLILAAIFVILLDNPNTGTVRDPAVALNVNLWTGTGTFNIQHSYYLYLFASGWLFPWKPSSHSTPLLARNYFPNKKANSSSWVNAGTFECGLPPPNPVEPLKFTTCCLPTIASKLRLINPGENQFEDDVFGDVFELGESRLRWRGLDRRDFGHWCWMAV